MLTDILLWAMISVFVVYVASLWLIHRREMRRPRVVPPNPVDEVLRRSLDEAVRNTESWRALALRLEGTLLDVARRPIAPTIEPVPSVADNDRFAWKHEQTVTIDAERVAANDARAGDRYQTHQEGEPR